jgi:hypothetical protein
MRVSFLSLNDCCRRLGRQSALPKVLTARFITPWSPSVWQARGAVPWAIGTTGENFVGNGLVEGAVAEFPVILEFHDAIERRRLCSARRSLELKRLRFQDIRCILARSL